MEEVLNYKEVTPDSGRGVQLITTIKIMKEKIENLIKEVGVNEVESVLKQMKSKLDVKQELKKDFVELLTGSIILFSNDYDIDYRKNGDLLFFYRKTKNTFYLRYKFWLDFERKYNLYHQELSDLLVDIVEEVLNYKEVTPLKC